MFFRRGTRIHDRSFRTPLGKSTEWSLCEGSGLNDDGAEAYERSRELDESGVLRQSLELGFRIDSNVAFPTEFRHPIPDLSQGEQHLDVCEDDMIFRFHDVVYFREGLSRIRVATEGVRAYLEIESFDTLREALRVADSFNAVVSQSFTAHG